MVVLKDSVIRKLENLYVDPKSPASFGGIDSLYYEARRRKIKVTKTQVADFLKSKSTYQLHLLRPGRFIRPRMIAYGFRYLFQTDIFYSLYPDANRKRKYMLVVVE